MTETAESPRSTRRFGSWLPEPGPIRIIVLISLISSVGMGLFMSGSAVYFVRSVGLSPTQVGVGLSCGGVAGLALGVPIGHLADSYGPRLVTRALTAFLAVLLVAATQVHSYVLVLVILTLLGVVEAGTDVGRGAIISALVGAEDRVRVSAYSRSVFNAGFSVGVLAAGVAIGVDNRPAYLSLMLGNALTAISCWVLYARLPQIPGNRADEDSPSMMLALRDLPYVAVAQVTGLTRLGAAVLTVGMPLWVVEHTDAPRPLAAWLITINTLLVVLLQVRAARGATTVAAVTRLQLYAFVALVLACVAAAFTADLGRWPAVALLVVVTVLLTMGELWGESARWLLRYELAPDSAQGQYGGVFQLGTAVPTVAGPAMVTALTDHLTLAGWLVIAAVFAVGVVLTRPSIAWAQRTRVTEE